MCDCHQNVGVGSLVKQHLGPKNLKLLRMITDGSAATATYGDAEHPLIDDD